MCKIIVYRQTLLLVSLACVLLCGCGEKKESKNNASSDPSSKPTTDPKEVTKPDAPDLASIDVSFLVGPCVDSGLPAEACHCAGEDAKTRIGHELLGKMGKAPADEDPAIQTYYTHGEMQKIVSWVDQAGVKCGLEEAE